VFPQVGRKALERVGHVSVDFAATPFRLGRELTIDPQTERSTDAEANHLFSRDYRKGFELPRV
ncbi:MAG: hypothetical protein ACKOK8_16150, partial [Planctomycetia bacterium]